MRRWWCTSTVHGAGPNRLAAPAVASQFVRHEVRHEEGQPAVLIAIEIFTMGGQPVLKVIGNQAFLFSFFLATVVALLVIPYAKRRPKDKKAVVGRGMLASMYAFGVMFVAFGVVPAPVDRPRRRRARLGQDEHRLRPVRHPQAHGARRRLVPVHHPVRGRPRHRRRAHPRVVLRAAHLPVGQVAEAWRGDARAPTWPPAPTAARW